MNERGKSVPVWFIWLLISVLCVAGWVSLWRTKSDWFPYVLVPVLVFAGIVIVGAPILIGIGIEGKPRKWAIFAAVFLVFISCAEIRDAWPEIRWGSPRIKMVSGTDLIFESGEIKSLPLQRVTPKGLELLALEMKPGCRVSLSEIRSSCIGVLMDGLAVTDDPSLAFAQDSAKENKYGIWGGGSYEKDLRLLDELRERIGDDVIKREVQD